MYIYKHLSKEGLILYVGKTINMKTRQLSHSKTKSWFNEVETIEFAEVCNKTVMDIYELYYINLLKPKYNKIANRKDSILSLDLKDLEFTTYNFDFSTAPTYIERSNTTHALDYYESKFMVRYIGDNVFRFYCELLYVCEDNLKINNNFFVKTEARKYNKYMKILEKYGILKYTISNKLYTIDFINTPYRDEILKLRYDFYETYNEITNSQWSIFFLSYCYNLNNTMCNPSIAWNLGNIDSIIMNMCDISLKSFYKITDILNKNYNYSYNVGFDKSILFMEIKKDRYYQEIKMGYYKDYLNLIDDNYPTTHKEMYEESNKYDYLMRGY